MSDVTGILSQIEAGDPAAPEQPDGKFLVVATQGSDLQNVRPATRLYALP